MYRRALSIATRLLLYLDWSHPISSHMFGPVAPVKEASSYRYRTWMEMEPLRWNTYIRMAIIPLKARTCSFSFFIATHAFPETLVQLIRRNALFQNPLLPFPPLQPHPPACLPLPAIVDRLARLPSQ
ncbi:hypothetical protein CGRA01v4_07831 [Colletotrichum graminicola]|nr:hypothetical protein CGRA01v4_07831 [Colletotrichum graminicola]